MSYMEPVTFDELMEFQHREWLLRVTGREPGASKLSGRGKQKIHDERKKAGLVEVHGILLPEAFLMHAVGFDDGRDRPKSETADAFKVWVTRCVLPHLTGQK